MTPYTEPPKAERLQIRLDGHKKAMLERAAALAHQHLGEFVLDHAVQAAAKTIEEHEKITLPEADWTVFFDALVNPPEPNEALRRAWERFSKRRE
jgi:uncharacterized protein (DUF1778 family)